MTRVLGIDPGLSGALALWDDDLNALQVFDIPTHSIRVGKSKTLKRQLNEVMLADLVRSAQPDRAICEQVHAMPGQGVTSMFSFGVTYGIVRGVLAALDIPVTYVDPKTWQRAMRVATGKDASRQRVTQLLPAYANLFARAKDDGRADATLIALTEFC